MATELKEELLARDEFRTLVFGRDGGKCLACDAPAKDAHHIVERRLWGPSGGYFLGNGASVCEAHHIEAEQTLISCEQLREWAGIDRVYLPDHFYPDEKYDKWGNPILENGQRLRGELFEDPSVQKILQPVLHLFTNRVKHPRTFHFPWSRGVSNDDRVLHDLSGFEGRQVVTTVKMDGEQTTMYADRFHARSINSPPHPSRDWLWKVQKRIGYQMPAGYRICGENLYAKHSIAYRNLSDHFLVHSIWDETNCCLSWQDTLEWAELLELKTVPVYSRDLWHEQLLRNLKIDSWDGDPCEGYVVRVEHKFPYRDYRRLVGKYVRAGHVQTHGHWMREQIEVNGLKG